MWPLILKQWPLILLGMALAVLTVTWNLYQEQRDATQACRISSEMALAQATAERTAMEVRNQESLGKLNRDHAKKLADAVRNARLNWSGISLSPQSAVPAGSGVPADRACPSDAAVGQLLVNCATDANTISEWQRWATLNRLPIQDAP